MRKEPPLLQVLGAALALAVCGAATAQPAPGPAGSGVPEAEKPRAPASPEIEPEPAPLAPQTRSSTAAAFLEAGLHHFRAEEYLLAAEALEKAYALDPQPLLLFNAAQALRKAGRPREALTLYERFLVVDPQSTLRGEAEGYRNDMRALLAEQARAAEVRAALLAEQERMRRQEAAAAADRQRAERAQRALLAERVRLERERRRPVYRWAWFWGVVAAGAAVVGAGIGLGVALAPSDRATDGGFVQVVF